MTSTACNYIIETSAGDIHIELDAINTPKTAANFREYVEQGFYENTIFHRVINNFMIQGGGMDADMVQKEAFKKVENEAKSAIKNDRGTIAMARTSDPHSASSQFFINLVHNDFLNFTAENNQGYGYCAFGKVTKGMDVVDAIANVRTGNQHGHNDVPLETVVIHSIKTA